MRTATPTAPPALMPSLSAKYEIAPESSCSDLLQDTTLMLSCVIGLLNKELDCTDSLVLHSALYLTQSTHAMAVEAIARHDKEGPQ